MQTHLLASMTSLGFSSYNIHIITYLWCNICKYVLCIFNTCIYIYIIPMYIYIYTSYQCIYIYTYLCGLCFPDFPAGLNAAIFGPGTSPVDSAMSQVCDVTKLDLTETFDAVVEKGCILVAVLGGWTMILIYWDIIWDIYIYYIM